MPPLPGTRKQATWEPARCGVRGGHKGWLVVQLDGHALGPLFVARHTEATGAEAVLTADGTGKWLLSVASVGYQLLTCDDEAGARQAGRILYDDVPCRHALSHKSRTDILKHIPAWVKPWAAACTLAGKCVDPGPYQTF